jgi:AcrR family transcriptional regulator
MILEYKKAVISKIVETAFEIFSTKGYQDLTMDAIAKRLGISKGALYSYFTSKDEILKEIYKNGRQTMQKILSESSEEDGLDQVMENIFKLTEKYGKNIRIYFEVLALATHNETIRNTLKDDYEKDFRTTCEFIEHLAREHKVRTDVSPQVLAQFLRSIWMGTVEKMVLGCSNEEIRKNWLSSTVLFLGVETSKS